MIEFSNSELLKMASTLPKYSYIDVAMVPLLAQELLNTRAELELFKKKALAEKGE